MQSPSVTIGAVSKSIKLEIDPTTKKNIPIFFIFLYLINNIIQQIIAVRKIHPSFIDFGKIHIQIDINPTTNAIVLIISVFLYKSASKIPIEIDMKTVSTIRIPL